MGRLYLWDMAALFALWETAFSVTGRHLAGYASARGGLSAGAIRGPYFLHGLRNGCNARFQRMTDRFCSRREKSGIIAAA
ncbi:hypothetical protein B5E84_12740 [Lachnoclostridium sp. An14]|nr:hypothetical protein B5E84_12740 [Lachnoclostridium sp. An14]